MSPSTEETLCKVLGSQFFSSVLASFIMNANYRHDQVILRPYFESKGPRDFSKLRILGKGGVGRVYLVQLKGTDKLFAMKVLKQDEMISRNKVRKQCPASSTALALLAFYFIRSRPCRA